jgi:hypothetical protein
VGATAPTAGYVALPLLVRGVELLLLGAVGGKVGGVTELEAAPR